MLELLEKFLKIDCNMFILIISDCSSVVVQLCRADTSCSLLSGCTHTVATSQLWEDVVYTLCLLVIRVKDL